jgi:hypothetical protein
MLLALDHCYITEKIVDIIMLLSVDHCYITDKLWIQSCYLLWITAILLTSCVYNHVTYSGSLLYYGQVVDIIMLLALDHCYITDKLWI